MTEEGRHQRATQVSQDKGPGADQASGRVLAQESDLPAGQVSESPADILPGADEAPAESRLRGNKPPDFIRQYELVDKVMEYDPEADEALLNRAYVFALQAHGEQKRSSGDPYFSHPLAVAGILTELKLDTATIATALLHDVVEDTDVTIAEIEESFGAEVARLVDGVTKISKRELAPDADGKADNFAKFLLATAKDVRVLLVKLADRLHNMRTLHYLKKQEKRERIALETMEIYAPMASRIGVQRIREELEDLSFKYLNETAYETITEGLNRLRDDAVHDVIALAQTLRTDLRNAGITAEVYSREKRAFSIWRKMHRKRNTFEELADIYAFRVLTETVDDCYRALGVIHRAFHMIPDEFDDYISTPKPNGYQSIHTAVLATAGDREGQRVEVQIRTKQMHDIAERGVAAHWKYKDATARASGDGSVDIGGAGTDTAYEWLRGVLETMVSEGSSTAALDQAKIDLYQDQVFPFTPKGRVIPLPAGATVLDFAYALHTEVGDQFSGARINGVARPARTPLRNGDVIEIIKNTNAPIPTGWDSYVVTGAAKSGIRRRIRALKSKEQQTMGERIVTSAFAARDLPFSRTGVETATNQLGFSSVSALYEAVGRMDISGKEVLEQIFPDVDLDGHDVSTTAIRYGAKVPRRAISIAGVTPGGVIRLGSCCRPLPGERIVGLRDAEEGAIIVHRIDCEILAARADEEWLDLSWSEDISEQFVAPIILTVNNKTGALGHLGTMLARYGADIVDLKLQHREVDFYDLCFDIAVRDARHLARVLTGLRASDYVVAADQRMPQEEEEEKDEH
ncbi:bifunctional (p)ppGpp synthetase/guanosine-3',5'-bis(diphosphate) 3'-pyrophosphohydrolase [Parvularcula marina]|uniref:RelA/SpoT family protein n=1 Tax=Parvularcula marina TaxID=2292771 RepID=UPI003519D3BC